MRLFNDPDAVIEIQILLFLFEDFIQLDYDMVVKLFFEDNSTFQNDNTSIHTSRIVIELYVEYSSEI